MGKLKFFVTEAGAGATAAAATVVTETDALGSGAGGGAIETDALASEAGAVATETDALEYVTVVVNKIKFLFPLASKMPAHSEIGPLLVDDSVHAKKFGTSNNSVSSARGSLLTSLYKFAAVHADLTKTKVNVSVVLSMATADEFDPEKKYVALGPGQGVGELRKNPDGTLGADLELNHKFRQRVSSTTVATFGVKSGCRLPFGSGRVISQAAIGTTISQSNNTIPAHVVRGAILGLAGAVSKPDHDVATFDCFEGVIRECLTTAVPGAQVAAAEAAAAAFIAALRAIEVEQPSSSPPRGV